MSVHHSLRDPRRSRISVLRGLDLIESRTPPCLPAGRIATDTPDDVGLGHRAFAPVPAFRRLVDSGY